MNISQNVDLSALLDWSTPFDSSKVQLYDSCVQMLHSNDQNKRSQVHNVLNDFQAHPDAWQAVDTILLNSSNTISQFQALSILDFTIQQRWNILSAPDKEGIRGFLVNHAIKLGQNPAYQSGPSRATLQKLNKTLVSVVKHEWTTSWQTFIPDLCNSCRQSQHLIENAFSILRELSQEIFDFSKGRLQSKQAQELKQRMNEQFSAVYDLCTFVIENAVTSPDQVGTSLIKQCLKTLEAFLSWVPLGYIFETQLFESIIKNFIKMQSLRSVTNRCLIEIASLDFSDQSPEKQMFYRQRLTLFYCVYIEQVHSFTKGRNLADEYRQLEQQGSPEQFITFMKELGNVITGVFKNCLTVIEEGCNSAGQESQEVIMLRNSAVQGFTYLTQLSTIPEEMLFRMCLDYWHSFTHGLVLQLKSYSGKSGCMDMSMMLLNSSFLHSQCYPEVLKSLREMLINNMAKPREVLIMEDDNGDVVEVHFNDTENHQMFDTMREVLIFLTNIDQPLMDNCIQARLDLITQQRNQTNYDQLNKLCWALGSISGCMSEDEESRFVVSVIKELLNLCENTKGKNSKALVASNIMYVVGSFPRFLSGHWAFLKTVIRKLNEFMHETHPGVQDMAAETFLKIAKMTAEMFVVRQDRDTEPYIYELIRKIPENLNDLEPHQKLQVYEGLGYIVASEKQPQTKEHMTVQLLQFAHNDWTRLMQIAQQNTSQLMNPDLVKMADFLIKINQRVAQSVGFYYLVYLRQIFTEMLQLYSHYSTCISQAVSQGANMSAQAGIKPLRGLLRDSLKLIQTFVENSDQDSLVFQEEFLPALQNLTNVYRDSAPDARDPEVLQMFATIMKCTGPSVVSFLPSIMTNLCEVTLPMIQADMVSFPEFREAFFSLIKHIVQYCVQGLFSLDSNQFNTVILSILWAMKHTKPEQFELGLEAMNMLVEQVAGASNNLRDTFFQNYLTLILQDTLTVMTDNAHTGGFKLQAELLRKLFQVVEQNLVSVPVFQSDNQTPHQASSNKEFLMDKMSQVLTTLFVNVNPVQIQTFVIQLATHCGEWQQFKVTLRDLLIATKIFAADDNTLYQEEMKVAQEEASVKDQQKRAQIVGLPGQQTTTNGNNFAGQQAFQ